MADQGGADGALVADAVQVHVSLGGTGDVVGFRLLALLLDGDVHTDGNGIAGQLAVVDDAGDFQGSLQVSDAGLDNGLLFLSGVVLGILAQVAVATCNLDLISNLFTFNGAQFVQVMDQFIIALTGNNDFFRHGSFS